MNPKILVIDDDKLILETLSRLFIRENWSVDICQDSQEGLKLIENKFYDCVLLDVRMPGMNGVELLSKVREIERKTNKKQNVIIMTGYADEDAAVKAFQLSVYKYISKPFDIQELLKIVNECAGSTKFIENIESLSLEEREKEFKKIRKLYDKESLDKKVDILSNNLNVKLKHVKGCTYDTENFKGNIENPIGVIQVPLGVIGPIHVRGKYANGEFVVPMATTEGALLLTYDLGSRLLSMEGPIEAEVLSKVVHITPMFPIKNNEDVIINKFILDEYENIKKVAEGGSSHTKLLGLEEKKLNNNYLLKFKYDTGDAQGLNMINQASFNACKYIQSKTGFEFYHRSHYSGVKHYSPLNEEKGYGRVVKAKALISSKALAMLRVSSVKMKDFFDRCIECGNSAGIKSVNVHASNAIAAIFMACGQDMADISSAHTCETRVDFADNNKALLIQVTLKNLLVATVGGGTGLATQSECLKMMDCHGSGKSDKFAEIIAATVLSGEFPTAAAVISETYVDIHNKYGRNKSKIVCD